MKDRTMHPEQGLFTVSVRSGAHHPIVAGLDDFTVFDERSSYLHTNPDITVVGEHLTDGRLHPIVWARESGPARVVYNGLGHDTRSTRARVTWTCFGALEWLLQDREVSLTSS
jgi:type 1 glutamine amidotransferase